MDIKDNHSKYINFDSITTPIIIMHSTFGDVTKVVFANKSFYILTGINEEEFMETNEKGTFSFIHDDDFKYFYKAYTKSLVHKVSMNIDVRIKTINSDSFVVNFSTSIKMNPNDDTYDVYITLIDVNTLAHSLEIRNRRYKEFIKQREIAKKNSAFCNINLTHNTISNGFCDVDFLEKIKLDGTAEQFFNDIERTIVLEEYKEEFRNIFEIDKLIEDFYKGKTSRHYVYPFILANRDLNWYDFIIRIECDPVSNDFIAFVTMIDNDNNVELEIAINRLISNDYEAMLRVDAITGRTQMLGSSPDLRFNGKLYKDVYGTALEELIISDYVEDALETLNLEKIVNELEKEDLYTVSYPCISLDVKKERICQWRCGYIGKHRRMILITRIDHSKYADDCIDIVTGIENQIGFAIRSREILNNNPKKEYAIVRIDFDGFKLFNDKNGYTEGNRFLRHFAVDMKNKLKAINQSTLVARLQADNFVCLIDTSKITPEELHSILQNQIRSYEKKMRLAFSMGVYIVKDRRIDIEIMCDSAYLALKTIKNNLKKEIAYYTPFLKDKFVENQLLIADLKRGIEEKQFEVWYQPQINHLKKGTIVGAEALVRWRHPERGMIYPGDFIPICENNGFIYDLDLYIWETVCQDLKEWLGRGDEPIPISVNVSRHDLMHQDFIVRITEMISKYNTPLDLLHLEITESAFVDTKGAMSNVVKELIDLGFFIAIDDFGSGYSSLSMLRDIHAQMIKLDLRFFETEENDIRSECIIESIARMAKMLGMAVLAEGVENENQADFLTSIGCNYIQGYLYSKPLNKTDFEKFYKKSKHELTKKVIAISDRKKLKSSTSNDRELYHSIITENQNIVWVIDKNTKNILYANPAAEKFYGKSFDSLASMKCYEFKNKSDQCEKCPINRMKNGVNSKFVIDEKEKSFEVNYYNINWNNQEAIVIYQNDVTKEKQENEISNSIIKNIPGLMTIFTEQENGEVLLTYINESVKSLIALPKVESRYLTLRDCLSFVYRDDIEKVKNAAKHCIENKNQLSLRFRVYNYDRRIKWIILRVNPVLNKNGRYTYYCLYTDIKVSKSSRQDDVDIQKTKSEIYQQVINDETHSSTERLLLSLQFDLTEHKLVKGWSDEIECYPNETEHTNDDAIMNNLFSNVIGKDSLNRVKEAFSNERILSQMEEQGYSKSSAEYLRRTKSGKICFVRTEIKCFKELSNNHLVGFVTTYDIGSLRIPNIILSQLISPTIDSIGIYYNESGVSQIWDIEDAKSVYNYIVSDYHIACKEYSNAIIDEEKEAFMNVISIKNVFENLTKKNSYSFSFWINNEKGKFRKTWEYSFLDKAKEVLLMSRHDTTELYTSEQKKRLIEKQQTINEGLQKAINMLSADETIQSIINFIGKTFNGERSFIFEKNIDGTSSNTYEWTKEGIISKKENLQNIPEDICSILYNQFNKNKIIIQNLDELKKGSQHSFYKILKQQNVNSLIAFPLFNNIGEVIGFFGIDNPPRKELNDISELLRTVEYFIESNIKKRELVSELERLSFTDELTGVGNRHALDKLREDIMGVKSIGVFFCDMHGLKLINDKYGHKEGDLELIRLIKCIKNNTKCENLFRMGGDEVAIVFVDASSEEFEKAEEKLRNGFMQDNIYVGIGTSYEEVYKNNLDEVIGRAEKKMYEDKDRYYAQSGLRKRV